MVRGTRVVALGLALWAASSCNAWMAFCGFSFSSRDVTVAHAATPNFGDLLGSMGKVSEAMKKMPDLQKRLRETPSKGSALGGRINITLSGDLAPLGVEIDEGLMEEGMSSKVMADAVFLAMREAHNASLELSRTELAKFYKEMGVPMPGAGGGLPGMPSGGGLPSQPAAPAPPPMEFDPAGLGPKIVD